MHSLYLQWYWALQRPGQTAGSYAGLSMLQPTETQVICAHHVSSHGELPCGRESQRECERNVDKASLSFSYPRGPVHVCRKHIQHKCGLASSTMYLPWWSCKILMDQRLGIQLSWQSICLLNQFAFCYYDKYHSPKQPRKKVLIWLTLPSYSPSPRKTKVRSQGGN